MDWGIAPIRCHWDVIVWDIHYFDAALSDSQGQPAVEKKKAFCMHEERVL
jgi:hypothetical protein